VPPQCSHGPGLFNVISFSHPCAASTNEISMS
jgi:hypothetical protein